MHSMNDYLKGNEIEDMLAELILSKELEVGENAYSAAKGFAPHLFSELAKCVTSKERVEYLIQTIFTIILMQNFDEDPDHPEKNDDGPSEEV